MGRNRAHSSFMTRLGRDTRGNTIALAAAAMVPMAGLIGGGVDMSRLYLTKTRLQQACDAGALAGRKAMAAGSWTTAGSTSSNTRANELFTANFSDGSYGTGTLTKGFTESNGTVSGTASVAVPMTVMRVFGMTSRSLAVTCQAKMEIPNTDVMFVLDVTGSMNCVAGNVFCSNNGGVAAAGSKIDGIKSAVKCFYEALLKINTTEVCGSDPTTTTYTQSAQIRIGFVPYSVNVNLGKLLPNTALADSWKYQTRVANFQTQNVVTGYTPGPSSSVTDTNYSNNGSWSGWSNWNTYTGVTTSNACNNKVPSTDYAGIGSEGAPYGQTTTMSGSNQVTTWYTDQAATRSSYQVGSYTASTDVCVVQRRQRPATITLTYTRTDTPVYTPQQVFQNWTYKQASQNVAGLKAGGSTWNGSVSLPLGSNGTNTSIGWDGCIEERATVKNSDTDPSDEWSPIPTAAFDMDIDRLPDSTITGSQWGPMLPDAVWGRYSGSDTTSDVTTTSDLSHNDYYVCPTEAKKLQTWYTPSTFVTYVDSLNADGNTYHDIGMIWGARFISPTGIFASENAETPTGGAIQRHIIFMTDGDTNSQNDDYNAYGIGWWDRRQTTYAPNSTNLGNIINARLTALCTAIKNKNITLWVISYGGGINATTESRLSTCATSGKYFSAANTPALIANFKQIASEISELRLTN